MKGFLADVEFIWGFQSRVVGMSKSSPSFLLPPPTTVLGAIAEAYARRKGLSEGRASATMTELAKDLLLLTY
ncbi:MAG: type I-A CRISPR-associated protein Cas5a, partial [Thermofilum sp.]